MAVRLVARVSVDNMEVSVLYPHEDVDQERIAMLTGIVQLISAALERDKPDAKELRFMKSETGVIGYCQVDPYLVICEGDNENETEDALRAVVDNIEISKKELSSRIEKAVKQRCREIGDLWS